MRALKFLASLLVACVLVSGCSQVISDSKTQIGEQTKEIYVLKGANQKVVLDSTQQEKLDALLNNWEYSDYYSENELLYGGQMFRVVVADSTGETVWAFGENGITVNSIDKDGVLEPIAKYGTDEALFSKVKNIVYGEDTQ